MEVVKLKLMEYWETHRNYNPRNPEHKKEEDLQQIKRFFNMEG